MDFISSHDPIVALYCMRTLVAYMVIMFACAFMVELFKARRR